MTPLEQQLGPDEFANLRDLLTELNAVAVGPTVASEAVETTGPLQRAQRR